MCAAPILRATLTPPPMHQTPSLPTWLTRPLFLVAVFLMTVPVAFAAQAEGGTKEIAAAKNLEGFLGTIANLFTGTIGTAIGIIAFAVAGIYIMYARQTGQAIGAIAKVFVGLLILFGGAALVKVIGEGGGAAF